MSIEGQPGVVRLTTDAVEARHRAALMSDVMAQHLAGGRVQPDEEAAVRCDWRLALAGPGTVIADVTQHGFSAERDARMLGDGDADFSLFLMRSGRALFDHGDRRVALEPGRMLLVSHANPCVSRWENAACTVLRVPRAAMGLVLQRDAAAGMTAGFDAPAMRLLLAYLVAARPLVEAGAAPMLAARHLGELAAAAVGEALGDDARPGEAARAARLVAMHRVMAERLGDAGLCMAEVAASVGISERAGYLLFEEAEQGFTATLYAMRLDRAMERLRGGYAGRLLDLALDMGFTDLSHFNRRFRARFGMTPGEARVHAPVAKPG